MIGALARAGFRFAPPTAATASYLLDTLSASAVAAHGLRRLKGAYTGPCIRVRRSSDNAEQDIGFTTAGDLDVATMLTFVGSSSGSVPKHYDQSGNGNHLVQVGAGNQPQIVNSGTTQALGNTAAKPTLYYGGFQALTCTPGITGSQIACFAVAQDIGHAGDGRMIDYYSGTYDYDSSAKIILMILQNNLVGTYSNGYRSRASYGSAPFQASTVCDGTNNINVVDGVAGNTADASGVALSAQTLFVGSWVQGFGSGGFQGDISETLLFGTAPAAADIAAIRTSQKSYYGTP